MALKVSTQRQNSSSITDDTHAYEWTGFVDASTINKRIKRLNVGVLEPYATKGNYIFLINQSDFPYSLHSNHLLLSKFGRNVLAFKCSSSPLVSYRVDLFSKSRGRITYSLLIDIDLRTNCETFWHWHHLKIIHWHWYYSEPRSSTALQVQN